MFVFILAKIYMINLSVLMKKDSKLIAVHEGKYFKRSDGLAVGPGCFTRGLEYATGKTAIVIGKPNPYFFNCAIPEGILPHECCMIGDVSLTFPVFSLIHFISFQHWHQVLAYFHTFNILCCHIECKNKMPFMNP